MDGITKFEISWANQFAVWCICSDNTVKLSVVAAFPGPHTSFCHSQYHLYQSASDRKLDNILGMRPCLEWPWQPSSLLRPLLLIPVVAKWTHPLSRQLRILVPWKPTIDWFQWIGNWISIFHFFCNHYRWRGLLVPYSHKLAWRWNYLPMTYDCLTCWPFFCVCVCVCVCGRRTPSPSTITGWTLSVYSTCGYT